MIRILQFKGRSLISRAIQLRTWGEYSHTAVLVEDEVIEAWHRGGVQRNKIWNIPHTDGTEIDVYALRPSLNEKTFVRLLSEEVGKGYDFQAILGFLGRKDLSNPDRWFCSELVFAMAARAGCLLLNAPAYKVDPNLLSYSPLLKFERSIIWERGNEKILDDPPYTRCGFVYLDNKTQ